LRLAAADRHVGHHVHQQQLAGAGVDDGEVGGGAVGDAGRLLRREGELAAADVARRDDVVTVAGAGREADLGEGEGAVWTAENRRIANLAALRAAYGWGP
jgi:hypothetical protein